VSRFWSPPLPFNSDRITRDGWGKANTVKFGYSLRLAEEKNSDDYIGDKDKINPDA
jgi:hypothetical protein